MLDRYVNKHGVRHNKLNITDSTKLLELESSFTKLRIKEIQQTPSDFQGDLSISHLKKLHAYIFQDIYDADNVTHIAGKLRNVDLYGFSKVGEIEKNQNKISEVVRGLKPHLESYKEITKLAHQSWSNHAFNDGNTRLTLAIICLLFDKSELKLDISKSDLNDFRDDLESALTYKKLNEQNGFNAADEDTYCILYDKIKRWHSDDEDNKDEDITIERASEILQKQENKELTNHPKLLKLLNRIDVNRLTIEDKIATPFERHL